MGKVMVHLVDSAGAEHCLAALLEAAIERLARDGDQDAAAALTQRRRQFEKMVEGLFLASKGRAAP